MTHLSFTTVRRNGHYPDHLPSAGGSLIHPHIQIDADAMAANHHRFQGQRTNRYYREFGQLIFFDYLKHEKENKQRYLIMAINIAMMRTYSKHQSAHKKENT